MKLHRGDPPPAQSVRMKSLYNLPPFCPLLICKGLGTLHMLYWPPYRLPRSCLDSNAWDHFVSVLDQLIDRIWCLSINESFSHGMNPFPQFYYACSMKDRMSPTTSIVWEVAASCFSFRIICCSWYAPS